MLRLIHENDYNMGYSELLTNLTVTGSFTQDEFIKQLNIIKRNPHHQIWVIELDNKIVATATLIVEPKIIRNLGWVAHIEDVVVHKDYQGKSLGKQLIQHLITLADIYQCYKVILDCSEDIAEFYTKLGFHIGGFMMRRDRVTLE